MKVSDTGIDERLWKKAEELGIKEMTEIQEKTIPKILEGKDVVGQAQTGSGKTLSFAIPIIQKLSPEDGLSALVLTPTRELCVQVTDVFRDFGKHMGINATSVYGGVGLEPQIKAIKSSQVVVGTPGRILDHMGRGTIDFSSCKFLVLDETDRMLDMGFIDDVEKIIKAVPKERQTLMFSATISHDIKGILERHLKDPEMVMTEAYVDTSKLRQVYYDIRYNNDKFSVLSHFLMEPSNGLSLVFCATRTEADIVARNLKKNGINARSIHGGMTQNSREDSLDALKKEKTDVLVATDVAARGLDIKNITHVYNYDVPKTIKDYLHRIGRTARAGEEGEAITLLTERDHDTFRRIQRDAQFIIHRDEVPYFKKVPFSRGSRRDGPRSGGRFSSRGPGRGRSDNRNFGRGDSRKPRQGKGRPSRRRY